ncbi:hypothetical protein JXA88_15505 [Candidatus Fermentibacteria bacterium]|nr:hypothetical protein [Candidatus Fermentibacteria bacterium]
MPFSCLLALLAVMSSLTPSDDRWISFNNDPADLSPIGVLAARRDGVELEIRLAGMNSEDRPAMGTLYQRLSLPSGGRTADLGHPELPCYARLLAIPHGAAMEVRFTPVDSLELSGFTVWPAQTPPTDAGDEPPFVKDEAFYRSDALFPATNVMLTDAGTIRGYRVALLRVFPVRYDPKGSTLLIYTKARVEVDFTGGTGVFVEPRLRSRFFESLLCQTLLNYDALGDFHPLPRVREGEGEFLIIAADALVNAVAPLAQWRTAAGLPTVVVSRSTAGLTAEGIGQYIQNAYDQWETPPSFVLLVGDAEYLPTNYRYMHPWQLNMTAADLWYFTVDGTDFFADIHYGRVSVDNTSQLNQILTKLSSYEKTPQAGPWNNHVFLASYQEVGMYFTITSEQIYTYLNSIGYDVDRAYEGGFPPGTTQDVIDNFNQGCFLVNHRDHGGRENWVHPSFWISDFPQVNNGQMMPMVFSINCLSGYFDAETDDTQGTFESFSEGLLRKSPGGAIGVLSSSRTSYSGYNDELNKGLIDAVWPGFDTGYPGSTQNPWESPTFRPGAMLNYAKWFMYDKYVLTGGSGYPWSPTTQQTRLQMEMYHCHGDPTLDIHTAQPSAMVVSHDATVPLDTASFDVMVDVDGALAALSQDGSLVGRAYANAGVAHVVFDQLPAQGTVDIVVTAHNHIPHESEIVVVAASGWYVTLSEVAAADIAGYVDGVIDQGDSVALAPTVQNVGTMGAPAAWGRLVTSDENVTITVDSLWFGDIPAGGTSSGGGPVYLKIHGGLSDGTLVPLALEITSGDSLWTRPFSLAVHAPLLHVTQVLVDDALGNGNGYAEPGEEVRLWVTLANGGSGTAGMPQASLSCESSAVTIQSGEAGYPDIHPAETTPSLSPFQVALSPSCLEGTITFEETVTSHGPIQCVLPFGLIIGTVPVLVVDVDDEQTEQRLLDAMDQLEYQYRVWRTYVQGTVPADTLSLYRAVVWTGGDNNISSASPADQANLAQYLSNGGALLFSAENYLTSYGDSSFTANFLHVENFATGYDANWIDGVAGDPVADGFSTGLAYPEGLSNTPDELTPDPEAAAMLTAQPFDRAVAIRYPATGQGGYRVIFMAVPFEALDPGTAPPDDPATFLDCALAWLMDSVDLIPPHAVTDLSLAPGSDLSLLLTWQPAWDNVGVHHYAVHRETAAYFQPAPGTLLAKTPLTAWIDPTGAGDPTTDHFYVVLAVDAAGNQSAPSNCVGERETPVEP